MMKQAISVLLVLLLVLGLSACGGGGTPATDSQPEASASVAAPAEGDEPAADGAKKSIAVSLPPATDAWQARLLMLVEEEAKKETDKYEYVVKAATDVADQQNTLTSFKDSQYDVIVILPTDGDLMKQITEEIYDAGIKTIVLDRTIDTEKYDAFIGGDDYNAGEQMAHYLADKLGGEGTVAVLRNTIGSPQDLLRNGGFVDTMAAEYPGIEIIREVEGSSNREAGYKGMTDILPAVDHIDAVYAQVDESGLGALNAIQTANRTDIKYVVGIGSCKEAFELIKEGDTPFVATMGYFPTIGIDAMELARKVANGETPEKDIRVPHILVTQENVEEYWDNAY